MKRLNKIVLLLIILTLPLIFCGCNSEATTTQEASDVISKDEYRNNPAGYVDFYRSTEPKSTYVSVDEIMNYESDFSDCNGTWYKNHLSGEKLLVYNSFLYALEKRYIGFTLYVKDSDEDFYHIREMLSLDSPFLEQNYSDYEYIIKMPVNYVGESILVSIEQFTDSRWQMKMEALEKCRQIVAEIPAECETQLQKMKYLYDYVCDNVEYVSYEEMIDESYFYDAVCKGKTVCDGYSNMLSLLFNLIGVESCEVLSAGEGNDSGHTWVAAKIDGRFYNFDPTYEDTDQDDISRRSFFGFSDKLLDTDKICYPTSRPLCLDTSRDFMYADIIVNNTEDKDELKKIADFALERAKKGEFTTLIAVKSTLEKSGAKGLVDKIAWYIPKSVPFSIQTIRLTNGGFVRLTFNE